MPQASDQLRSRMEQYYGDPVDDTGPMSYLDAQGFELGRDWVYRKPGVRSRQDLSEQEADSIDFLADEWDMGGIEYDLTDYPKRESSSD